MEEKSLIYAGFTCIQFSPDTYLFGGPCIFKIIRLLKEEIYNPNKNVLWVVFRFLILMFRSQIKSKNKTQLNSGL